MSKYWLFFAFFGLHSRKFLVVFTICHLFYRMISGLTKKMKWHILCLTEWWSFISRIWVTTTFNRRWSISETLNSLTRKLLLFTFLFVFHSLSKLFNLKLLSNSWKQISRKLPKLKNLRNFHQTTHTGARLSQKRDFWKISIFSNFVPCNAWLLIREKEKC